MRTREGRIEPAWGRGSGADQARRFIPKAAASPSEEPCSLVRISDGRLQPPVQGACLRADVGIRRLPRRLLWKSRQ